MPSKSTHDAIPCPVCYADDSRALYELSSAEAAQHFVLRETNPERFEKLAAHIRQLWKQDTCHIRECGNCQFCFCDPFISGDERFYTLAYERSGYPTWKWEFQQTLDVLQRSAKPEHRLLELGAGNGAFVKRAVQLIPKENIVCTEFSEYGIGEIRSQGIRCLAEDVRNLPLGEFQATFDHVCMFQVLEHMDRLDELFEQLLRLMKPDGSLFIAVPNAVRNRFNELNGGLLDMPPNHIGRWNRKCFEVIGKRHGLAVKDHRLEPLGIRSRFKQFPVYRFLRNSQRSGSIENRICGIKNRQARRSLQAVAVGGNLMLALPAIARMTRDMGNAQWVHLSRV